MSAYLAKIRSREALAEEVRAAQARGEVVVHCHGCFDILHPGHLRHLTWAASQGDLLVVTLSSDAVVGKGHNRPYVPEKLRAETLAAIEVVGGVAIDDGEWAGPILELLRPDIYVKGKEFEDVWDGRFGRERRLVEGFGGRVMFSSGDVVYSSSEIIDSHRERLEPTREQAAAYCARHGIDAARLHRVLDAVRGKKILIVGETIVDRYIHVDPLGMSADSPVLAVRPREEETFIGAAAIVAQHVNALGAEARLVTLVGDDAEGERVRSALDEAGVKARAVVDDTRPTILKTRYLSEGKKLLNVNVFRDHDLVTEVQREVIERLDELAEGVDAVVVSDFSYGMITQTVLDWVGRLREARGLPVAGDVQCSTQLADVARLRGITVATPSEREARLSLCDRGSGVADLGTRLLQRAGNEAMLVTLGSRGMMVIERSANAPADLRGVPTHELKKHLLIEYLPSLDRVPIDPMGAGDALLATLTCALAAGGSVLEAAFLGNCAGALEVGLLGNIPVEPGALRAAVDEELG